MIFNSLEYFLFLPLVVILFYLVGHRLRIFVLLLASYYFYISWNPIYILLILASTLIDYGAGIGLDRVSRPQSRKFILSVSILANLGFLFFFKYFNFALENVNEIMLSIKEGYQPREVWDIILPVGISFYTFQTMSYTIDVYNGKTKPESIIVLDGLGVQTDVPDSPKWRFKVEVKLDGETFFVPVDNYFEIDGIGQADHDRLVQTGLDNRAIGELEKEGGRGYSPNAPHNLLRYGAGWFMHDLLGLDYKHLKKPAELEDKREEIKMREALDSEGPK